MSSMTFCCLAVFGLLAGHAVSLSSGNKYATGETDNTFLNSSVVESPKKKSDDGRLELWLSVSTYRNVVRVYLRNTGGEVFHLPGTIGIRFCKVWGIDKNGDVVRLRPFPDDNVVIDPIPFQRASLMHRVEPLDQFNSMIFTEYLVLTPENRSVRELMSIRAEVMIPTGTGSEVDPDLECWYGHVSTSWVSLPEADGNLNALQ